MANCNHKEADTQIVIHVYDALERGAKTVMVCTVDTDVVVILISQYHKIVSQYSEAEIWVAFGTSKQFRYYSINHVCANLGTYRSLCLPTFHAFIGCDTTSSFFGRTRKTAWATWTYPEVTEAFFIQSNNLYSQAISLIQLLERFTYHSSV